MQIAQVVHTFCYFHLLRPRDFAPVVWSVANNEDVRGSVEYVSFPIIVSTSGGGWNATGNRFVAPQSGVYYMNIATGVNTGKQVVANAHVIRIVNSDYCVQNNWCHTLNVQQLTIPFQHILLEYYEIWYNYYLYDFAYTSIVTQYYDLIYCSGMTSHKQALASAFIYVCDIAPNSECYLIIVASLYWHAQSRK